MIARNIEKALEKRGITKSELAEKCKITRRTLDNVINGSDAKISTIEAIARVLDVSISYFFEDEIKVKYENNGHHNPLAPEGEAKTVEGADVEGVYKELIKTKDDLIAELRLRIKELEERLK